MNTFKKTTLTFIGIGTLVATAFTFADDTSTSSHRSMMEGRENMHTEEGKMNFLGQYLRTNLTDTEKATLETVMKTHKDAVEALFQSSGSGSVAMADVVSQLKILRDQFITSLLPYILPGKQEALTQFITTMSEGQGEMMRHKDDDDKEEHMSSGTKANFEANVTRTITNIANGVQINETTTDSGTLARLQDMYNKGQNEKTFDHSTITVTRKMLSNGLQTIITSTDAVTVLKIQTQVKNSKPGFGIGWGYYKKGMEFKKEDNSLKSSKGNVPSKGMNLQKQSLLPANITSLVDARLASLSTNEAKIAWLNGINLKIDVLAAKVTAQKSKNILAELKDLLNQKIDAINNVEVDSSVLNNLLQ